MEKFYENLPEIAQREFDYFCSRTVLSEKQDVFDRLIKMSLDYSKCKSPIEVIFNMCFDLVMTLKDSAYTLQPQYEVVIDENKRYILDFAFIQDNVKVAIECDGHEFHERTKEQVEYGNTRDYDLKIKGFDVLHFSGSQIINDPIRIAGSVIRFINTRLEDQKGK